jgi:hypothetical protein
MFWVYDSSIPALLAAGRPIIRRARDAVNAHGRRKQMRAEIARRMHDVAAYLFAPVYCGDDSCGRGARPLTCPVSR